MGRMSQQAAVNRMQLHSVDYSQPVCCCLSTQAVHSRLQLAGCSKRAVEAGEVVAAKEASGMQIQLGSPKTSTMVTEISTAVMGSARRSMNSGRACR